MSGKPVQFVRRMQTPNGTRRRASNASDAPSASPARHALREHTNGSSVEEEDQTDEQKKAAYQKKKQSVIERTIWTFIMIGGFFACLLSGHIYILILMTVIQVLSFKEVIAISNVPSRARSLRFTKSLNWYFLGITMYYLYGESIIYYFKHIILVDRVLLPFATHHRFISLVLYLIGFVFFVMSLQKGHYKFQFTQFAWTHMALALIVVQAHFVMNNVLEGMIWFFLPVALVITNDIFAYVFGMLFGRTPLIQLSPKKTVEGFVGGWFATVLSGFLWTHIMSQSTYFICPVNDLGANVWSGLQCSINPVFIPRTYHIHFLPPSWSAVPTTVRVAPVQLHVLVLSTFASLIAPFGGFFASGLKRTFKIKDFGNSIPGHGGMTDRMDCQFIMGFFAFMYYQSFIAVYKASVGSIIEQAIIGLTSQEQVEVITGLTKHLLNKDAITQKTLDSVVALLSK